MSQIGNFKTTAREQSAGLVLPIRNRKKRSLVRLTHSLRFLDALVFPLLELFSSRNQLFLKFFRAEIEDVKTERKFNVLLNTHQ